jgi:riboflavin biosynthesis pyrimidine reductase
VSRFLEDGVANSVAVFSAPLVIGARGATPWVDGASAERPAEGWRLTEVRRIPMTDDLLVLGDLMRPRAGGA